MNSSARWPGFTACILILIAGFAAGWRAQYIIQQIRILEAHTLAADHAAAVTFVLQNRDSVCSSSSLHSLASGARTFPFWLPHSGWRNLIANSAVISAAPVSSEVADQAALLAGSSYAVVSRHQADGLNLPLIIRDGDVAMVSRFECQPGRIGWR